MSLRGELEGLLRQLEARVGVYYLNGFRDQGVAVSLFCLALGYRRRAIKPVERLSSRIQWAKQASEALDRLDAELANPAPEATMGRVRRSLPRP